MQFHPTQSIVAKDDTQFRVVNCGRQWGKTELAIWEMFACAVAKRGRRVGYFATTHAQARDIAWKRLKEISEPAWAKDPNETLLELWVNTADGGVSEISLKSWEAVEKSRGTQFDLLVLDEVSKMRNFQEGWDGALVGTLAFRRGKALFVSTPYGFNHFHKLYELGQGQNPLYKSWRFTSFDNPHLPHDYLHGIEQTVTTDFWSQEYLADFRRFTGLIYQEFDINTHVHEFEHTFNEHGEYTFGLDFAVRGYTACLPSITKENGETYHLDEYKERGLTAQQHIEAIIKMLTKYAPLEKWIGYADPAGFAKNQQKGEMLWALADEYLEAGFPIVRANNEVTPGINYVRQLHKANKIHVHPRCEMYIDEKLQYQWKLQSDARVGEEDDPEKVRKINDHLMDTERYELYSKITAPDPERKVIPGMPIHFTLKLDEPETLVGNITPISVPSPFDV